MKLSAVFCVLVCFTSVASAHVTYGLKGGVNFSDVVINNIIDPDAESDYKMKAGFHGGFFCIAEVGTRTGLSAELLYSNKGVKAINNINLHYISLPVLVRYELKEKFFAEGGPELAYMVAAKSRYGNISNVWNNKIDLGIDLGLQYNLLPKLITGIRFNAGISSLVRNANTGTGERIRYQNRVLQISIALALGKVAL